MDFILSNPKVFAISAGIAMIVASMLIVKLFYLFEALLGDIDDD